jgi:hypothetical protein
MAGPPVHNPNETPTVEVRVLRDGELVHQELCETADDAALVVEHWSEMEGVECEVDDLSAHHRAGDVLEPEPAVTNNVDEVYPPSEG